MLPKSTQERNKSTFLKIQLQCVRFSVGFDHLVRRRRRRRRKMEDERNCGREEEESDGANAGTTKIASWGWNRHYELGRSGPDRLPGLIDGLDGENPISVSVGLAHSLALTSKGKLWVWGSGTGGKLGFASPRKQPVPYYLDSLEAGMDHSLAICQHNESNGANLGTTNIASWGWNCHSQLGRSGHTDLPSLIDALDGENPISVSAGRTHSLALTSKGQMWVWGNGLEGRLGFDSPNEQHEPHYLDSLEGFQILQAVSGFDHNLVLVAG